MGTRKSKKPSFKMLRGWAGEECIFVPLPGQGVGLSPARGAPAPVALELGTHGRTQLPSVHVPMKPSAGSWQLAAKLPGTAERKATKTPGPPLHPQDLQVSTPYVKPA